MATTTAMTMATATTMAMPTTKTKTRSHGNGRAFRSHLVLLRKFFMGIGFRLADYDVVYNVFTFCLIITDAARGKDLQDYRERHFLSRRQYHN